MRWGPARLLFKEREKKKWGNERVAEEESARSIGLVIAKKDQYLLN